MKYTDYIRPRSEFETVINRIKRRTNTPSGNPRLLVSTPEGTWQTKPDAADASKLVHVQPGTRVILTLEKGYIKHVKVWTEFPNGEKGWY